MEETVAGCGSIIRKTDNWVCPAFCRPNDWKREHGKCGNCGIDLQIGTNICLYAPIFDDDMF